jgi:ribosome-binding ATPase YchF (GTP1/OBG family)
MKKLLICMMAVAMCIGLNSCKKETGNAEGGEKAEAAEQVVEKAPNLADVLAKAKAEGAKWSVDEWKASFKDLMLAIKPMMIDMKNMYDEIKKDPSKAAEAITKAAEVEKKYPKYSEMMDEFIEVASASENGRTVVDDEEWGKSLMKELGVPDFDEE